MVAGEISTPTQVIVLGGGPGGYTAAARATELGKQVVLVEAGMLGGTCLNVGCIPSKALITLGHDRHRLRRRVDGATGLVGAVDVDLAAARMWKDAVVSRLRAGVASLLDHVEVVQGTGRFIDADRVAVECDDHVSHYRFEHAVIATGSRPLDVPTLPVDRTRILDSTDALDLQDLPRRLAVVGGGYIGVEIGTAFAMLGAEVTIVELTDRLLGGFDRDVVEVVARRLDDLGVRVMTRARALDDDGTHLAIEVDGAVERLEADRVLVAVGRRPNTDDLQLEDAGLSVGASGLIAVDGQRRTAASRVFAIGDIVEGPALAHKASTEARVAAEAICGLPSAFDQVVPIVAFCDPELAAVGLGEDAAAAAGVDVVVGTAAYAVNGRALTLDDTDGFVKVVAEPDTGVILGVQIAGPSASDLISQGAIAVECALRVQDVALTVHPHPTLGEAVGDAARATLRRLERRRR